MIMKRIAVILVLLGLVAIVGWYVATRKPVRPVFDQYTQIVPEGAVSRSVEESLAALELPQPPPFFEKDNAQQSLTWQQPATSTTQAALPFLSYRVFGRDIEQVRGAFLGYAEDAGWQSDAIDGRQLMFTTPSNRSILVTLVEPQGQPADLPVVVVAITSS